MQNSQRSLVVRPLAMDRNCMRFLITCFRIHASSRALTLLSAASFSSAFDWTRGFHWLVSFRCFSTASSVHLSSCDSFISLAGFYLYTSSFLRFTLPPQRGRFYLPALLKDRMGSLRLGAAIAIVLIGSPAPTWPCRLAAGC